MANDAIVLEFKGEMAKLRKELDQLKKELGIIDDKSKKANGSIGLLDKTGIKLGSTFKKLGATMLAAFSIQQVARFALELGLLRAEAEGVINAFNKLNNPFLLRDLRTAVNGTVSDLELMRTAVQASNFKLPLDQLATLFEFASRRARETGESVDYLVQSVVLGISRKSIPIMDNLGISSTMLQEKMEELGDFGSAAISTINEELANMGDRVETSADKVDQFRASWENFKLEAGEFILPTLATLSEDLANFFTILNSQNISKLDKWLSVISGIDGRQELLNEHIEKQNTLDENRLKLIEDITREYQRLSETQSKLNEDNEATSGIYNKIQTQIDNLITLAANLGVSLEEVASEDQVKNLLYYDELLAILNKQLKEANLENGDYGEILKEIQLVEEERNKLLEKYAHLLDDATEKMNEFGEATLNAGKTFGEAFGSQTVRQATQASQEIASASQDITQQTLSDEESIRYQQVQLASQAFSQLLSFQDIAAQRELEILQEKLNNGVISERKYAKEVARIKRNQAISDKAAASFDIILNTGIAISKALTTPALIPFIAALGAAQLAAVAAQPIPKFAKGGEIGGKLHSQGGTIIEAEKGEYVINRNAYAANKQAVEAINTNRFHDYIMKEAQKVAIAQGQGVAYDDTALIYAVRRNGKVALKNEDSLARKIGREVSRQKYFDA